MKEAPHLSSEDSMLSRSQERLLRYLGGFPTTLEQAWDVPRDLSLPGLAEAMGVVRSGLNQPLTGLLDDGYLSVRVAHVIGGGSRRRQVYHITQQGRNWLEEHPEVTGARVEQSATNRTTVVGRESEIAALHALLQQHSKAVVGGLSGVGKTALVRAFALKRCPEFGALRWADVNEFSDAHALLSSWFPEASDCPHDMEAMVERAVMDGPSTLLVVDDIHRLSSRHFDNVLSFLNAVHERGQSLVLAGRLPLVEGLDWPMLRLSTLEPNHAKELLGHHLDEQQRLEIAKALGGHPMALHLYQEGAPLPEAGENIQAFVEQTMLSGLSDEERTALDSMVLFPRPLPATIAPSADWVGPLDDRALLRWTANSEAFEVQHLVRNVRRTMLTEEELRKLHAEAVTHWDAYNDQPAYAVLRLYHAMALELDDIQAMVEPQFERLMEAEGAAMAVLFDQATKQRPEDEHLHYWAGRVAIQRQELDHARHHLGHVHTESLSDDLAQQLALLDGDEREAKRLLERQLSRATSLEKSRMLLRAAVQALDDRLFDEHHPVDGRAIHALLNELELPDHVEWRTSIMVSMSMIQHTLALLEGDVGRAAELLEGLEAISSNDDAVVLQLKFKALMHAQLSEGTHTEEVLRNAMNQTIQAQSSAFHQATIGLLYAEHLVRTSAKEASEYFASLPTPESLGGQGAPMQRYAARWWYLYAQLNKNQSKMALRESSRCFRAAGCLHASKAVARRLHRLL